MQPEVLPRRRTQAPRVKGLLYQLVCCVDMLQLLQCCLATTRLRVVLRWMCSWLHLQQPSFDPFVSVPLNRKCMVHVSLLHDARTGRPKQSKAGTIEEAAPFEPKCLQSFACGLVGSFLDGLTNSGRGQCTNTREQWPSHEIARRLQLQANRVFWLATPACRETLLKLRLGEIACWFHADTLTNTLSALRIG